MKSKKNAVLLLTATVLLGGCGAPSALPQPEPAAEPSATPAPSYAEQEMLIMENEALWKKTEPYYDLWSYTITDLDHNGRCEVITSTMQGTGLYTYAEFYEVNESFNGLAPCRFEVEEGFSQADIDVPSCTCYHDALSDTYYYLIDDVLRNGAAEHVQTAVAVCLKNGTVTEEPLASAHTLADFETDGSVQVFYYDGNGQEITKEAYDSLLSVRFAGMESSPVSFEWVPVSPEDVREPSLVFASDLFDGYGFTHQLCDRTGVYDFSPTLAGAVDWQVYILDEEFTDAERFIPQAYECALRGHGSLDVYEGQWIYIYSPCNSWTGTEPPEGSTMSWALNSEAALSGPQRSYKISGTPLPEQTAEPELSFTPAITGGITITKHPGDECIAIGGHNWFIARAENSTSTTWLMMSPDGAYHSLAEAMQLCPGVQLEGLDETTLAVSNVPQSLNGWAAVAKFENASGQVLSDPAFIYVGDYLASYASVADYYRGVMAGQNIEINPWGLSSDLEMKNLGYKLKDLDGNGVPEMLVAQTTGSTGTWEWDSILYSVFTLENGSPVNLLCSFARNRYFYSRLGFLNEGSSGASNSVFYICRMNGSTLQNVEGVFTDGTSSSLFNYDRGNGVVEAITEQQFNTFLSNYESSVISLGQLSPF